MTLQVSLRRRELLEARTHIFPSVPASRSSVGSNIWEPTDSTTDSTDSAPSADPAESVVLDEARLRTKCVKYIAKQRAPSALNTPHLLSLIHI